MCKRILLTILLIFGALPLLATLAKAQELNALGVGVSIDVETIPMENRIRPFPRVYAAKFLCGTIHSDPSRQFPLGGQPLFVPGTYLTDLEILNTFPRRIGIQLLAGVTNPGLDPDPLAEPIVVSMEANEALQLDCSTIIATFFPNGLDLRTDFLKGWIVTRSSFLLHVMAVYQLKNVDSAGGIVAVD